MSSRRRTTRAAAGDGPSKPPKRSKPESPEIESRAKSDRLVVGDSTGRRTVISDEKFRENNKALTLQTFDEALEVESIDLFKSQNRKAHRTDDYELDELILRRGQAFSVGITFDRDIAASADVVVLQFAFGARPQESKGTLLRLPVNLEKSDNDMMGWVIKATKVDGSKLTVEVTSESDSMIGVYKMYVETKLQTKPKTDFTRFESDQKVYMIFNPWCEDDDVYMENEDERFEYVLNEKGRIWVGSARSNYGRPWNFGQFDDPVLEVALGLLTKGELAPSGRDCVSSVIRCLSALANACDDGGVLVGRWTETFPKGCTKPSEWTGSVRILDEYHKTGESVECGQCWVFSGLLTTLMRSLGIPTRSVTNFESAHDTDNSMTIDTHFDEEGEPLEDLNDSVWDFHVWNESYFRRNDLPEGYDGWQAHDATPQEASEKVMRCGPAPLKAIKEGHVYLSFDVGFIFAEVNGDEVQWRENPEDGSMEVLYIDRYAVGKCISTKAVGSSDRHDVTLDYKYPDGSEEERAVQRKVNRFSTKRKRNLYKQDVGKMVEFDLNLPEDKIVGEDIDVGVKIKNVSKAEHNMKVRLTLASTFYTGVVGEKVCGEAFEMKLKEGESESVKMSVPAAAYQAVMNPDANFKLTATCKVLDTDNMFATSETFLLKKPPITFRIPERICSSTATSGQLVFKNDTNLKLHGAVFNAESSYVLKAKSYPIRKVIQPGEEVSVDIEMFPRRLGYREIMATFSADELADVDGSFDVKVISKSDWKDQMEVEVENGEEDD